MKFKLTNFKHKSSLNKQSCDNIKYSDYYLNQRRIDQTGYIVFYEDTHNQSMGQEDKVSNYQKIYDYPNMTSLCACWQVKPLLCQLISSICPVSDLS